MTTIANTDAAVARLALSASQLAVLDALCNASLASTGNTTPFAAIRASDLPVRSALVRILANCIPAAKLSLLKIALSMLATRVGAFAFTGIRLAPVTDFTQLELERAVRGFAESPLSDLRLIAKAVKDVTLLVAFGQKLDGNALWDPIGFEGELKEKPSIEDLSGVWKPSFLDIAELAETQNSKTVKLTADVVVVGSGAGGGVVAAELATAGFKVIVLEKGKYCPPEELTHNELQSLEAFYENQGVFQSDNGSILILAGATFGGGTFVNWSASLRPPMQVRREWSSQHNLPAFESQAFSDSIDAVCDRFGVLPEAAIPHNVPNQIILNGSKKLGFPAEEIPQNTKGLPHKCGFCGLGCPYAEKQGTHVTYLRDAQEHGAQFIQMCYVDKVTHENSRVTGVEATVGNTKLVISCRTVVSSCGSLNTPSLLTRSGLRNKHIGKNLRLHPVSFIRGVFPDRQINPDVGPILTTLCSVVANRNGSGYGARIEIPSVLPGVYSVVNSYTSGADMKRKMLQYSNSCTMIILARDNDSQARVWQDSDGKLRTDFSLGKFDETSLVEGMIAGAKIMLAEGAREIDTSQVGLEPLKLSDAEMEDALTCSKTLNFFKRIREVGMHKKLVGSAHQMGSARMSSSAQRGVVDPDGQTWEVTGLYVADASLFPTASGVNPMITTLSVAHFVAQCIKKNHKLSNL
ncbi:hypothetical protein HDU84_000312 [Entophlyctis sp. JEL0112]|nr:hypothetical protein HDU84_000312 [Entophlyctis sp. JEL0112]